MMQKKQDDMNEKMEEMKKELISLIKKIPRH